MKRKKLGKQNIALYPYLFAFGISWLVLVFTGTASFTLDLPSGICKHTNGTVCATRGSRGTLKSTGGASEAIGDGCRSCVLIVVKTSLARFLETREKGGNEYKDGLGILNRASVPVQQKIRHKNRQEPNKIHWQTNHIFPLTHST